MKKLFLIIVGLFSIALWGDPCLAQDQAGKGPRIAVEGREFDFEDVKEGTVLEHTFMILNKGDEPLKIISVKPG
ncbi:MAG: DUF1573 domain-containing protein [Deltaproteobacteria bacterium]|nr:DUF1573 domain-containing protein [Deltaproteobacteria bacterium]